MALDPIVYVKKDQPGQLWTQATLVGMAGMPLYPTVFGADCSVVLDCGPFARDSMDYPETPLGYGEIAPGWYQDEYASFLGNIIPDPSTVYQSATITAGKGVSFPTIFGGIQVGLPKIDGSWSFRITNRSQGLFTNFMGGGVARAQLAPASAQPYTFLAGSSGSFGPGDPLGGGVVIGGVFNTYVPRFAAIGATVASFTGPWLPGESYVFAVAMSALPGPLTVPIKRYDPVALPCLPCCPFVPCWPDQ